MITDTLKRRQYNEAYRQSHKEEIAEYYRKYREEHREKAREYAKAYYQRKREKIASVKKKEVKQPGIKGRIKEFKKQLKDMQIAFSAESGVYVFQTISRYPKTFDPDFDRPYMHEENKLEKEIKKLLPWKYIFVYNISHSRRNLTRELYVQAPIEELVDIDQEILKRLIDFSIFS